MKRFVWPALKTLIAVIVAVALVKIAFFPSQGDGTTADISPGYAADVKTVPVTKGSISNTVSVKGHIVQDATVEVQADLAGVVDSVAVEKDTQVSAGDPLLYIKHSESQPPVTKTDESGNVTQTPTEDKVTWSTIYAPVSGTVTPKVLKQQETGVGVHQGDRRAAESAAGHARPVGAGGAGRLHSHVQLGAGALVVHTQ